MDQAAHSRFDRRTFVRTAASAVVAQQLAASKLSADAPAENNGMIYRTLGRTGQRVSAIGLGGYHIGHPQISEPDAIQLMRAAVGRGITFLDNCWDYNDGVSEVRMGKALAGGYRDRVFLMTKIDGRTRVAAAQQIDESLQRLQTDHIDLMQFHEVIRLEDPDRIFAEGGAMLDHARTHSFHFDAVQMPLNVMDAHFRSFTHEVLPVLTREGIAVLGMKCFGDHFILDSKTVKPIEALHYCLSLPIAVQITGIDSMQILDQALEATRSFKPLSEAEVASLLDRTRAAAEEGKFELYKTSARFDGTAHRPQVLG